MNETEFQALFDSYQQATRQGARNPVPQKLHLLIYNYAQLRHQQTSDVSADFYLHVAGKLDGILARYEPKRLPFYQYMASMLNFEFSHFLRRRKLPRAHIELVSVEELAERRLELQHRENPPVDPLAPLLAALKPQNRIYARLGLAAPLRFGELRYLLERRKDKEGARMQMLRGYREFLQFAEKKRQNFLRERDRLLKVLLRIEEVAATTTHQNRSALLKKREKARQKFFSMDTRIPIRIVAAVTGDSIATAQRQLKAAAESLKSVYTRWEKENLLET